MYKHILDYQMKSLDQIMSSVKGELTAEEELSLEAQREAEYEQQMKHWEPMTEEDQRAMDEGDYHPLDNVWVP